MPSIRTVAAAATLLLLATTAPLAHAWGETGHHIIANIARRLLTPAAAAELDTLLTISSRNQPWTIEAASTWADSVAHAKNTDAWLYSKPLHYVSAGTEQDMCGLLMDRDCVGGMCVVGALANYTARLGRCDLPGDRAEQRAQALRFVLHFAGDIAQPLHALRRARGANDLDGRFNGDARNLHSIWDGKLVDKRVGEKYGSKDAFITAAVKEIQDPQSRLAANVAEWSQCWKAEHTSTLDCAVQWAQESNEAACKVALPLYDANPRADLAAQYYETVKEGVELDLIKGGVRLAHLLNEALVRCHLN